MPGKLISFKMTNANPQDDKKIDEETINAIRSYLNLVEYLKKKAQRSKSAAKSENDGFNFKEIQNQMGLVGDTAKVAKHASIFINRLRFLLENRRFEKARILYKTLYINGCPLKFGGYAISIKRKYSEHEWHRFLISQSKFIKFARSFGEFTSKAVKYVGYTNKVISVAGICHSLYLLGGDIERVRREKPGATPKKMRDDLKNGYESMKKVMNLAGSLAGFAPVGVSDYIKMTVEIFNKAGVVIKIAERHAELWEEALKDIQKLEDKHNNPHTKKNMDSIYEANSSSNLTNIQQWERFDGIPSSRIHKK